MILRKNFIPILFVIFGLSSVYAQVDTVHIDIIPSEGGIVSGDGYYAPGALVTLEGMPNTGYKFDNWTENNSVVSTDSAYTYLSNGNHSLIANFSLKKYTILSQVSPNLSGTVNGTGEYIHGELVQLQAQSAEGYKFVNWTENNVEVSVDSNFTFTAESNRNLTANFELITFDIILNSLPIEGGNTTGGGNYSYSETVTITAQPNIGYTFVNWMENGLEISTESTLQFSALQNREITANFSLNSHIIDAMVLPENSGQVNGTGNFNYGSLVTLEAIPNKGYSFVNWTYNNVVYSTDTLLNITVESDTLFTANFSLNSYLISVSASPIQGGTVSGGGIYDFGEQVTLSATSVDGYNFVNWTKNDSVISTDSVFTFVCEENSNIIGHFSHKIYNVVAHSSPEEAGVILSDTLYEHGSIVKLKATSNYGWKFSNWSENDNILSIDSNYSFVIFNNKEITANYQKRYFYLNVENTPNEGGSSTGSGIYPFDSISTIIATPNYGWDFLHWQRNNKIVSEDSIFTVQMDSSKNITAVYKKKIFPIYVVPNPSIAGVVYGDSVYTYGDFVYLSAEADSLNGWEFSHWSENEIRLSDNMNYSFQSTKECTVVANFTLRDYEVDLAVYPDNSGDVIGEGTYVHGDSVTITAKPAPGWLFANWTDGINNISSDSIVTFPAEGNKTLIANFAHDLYSVGTSSQPNEGGFISGSGSFYYGQKANLVPIASPGWEFVNWSDGTTEISKDSILVLDVTNSINLVAHFKLINYSINCSVSPIEAGYTSGCGLSFYDQEMTLVATSNEGWTFVNWTENGDTVSTSSTLELKIRDHHNVIANFDRLTGLNDFNSVPEDYSISNAYPNPFNPSTKINFGIPERSVVKAIIYNIQGQVVRILYNNEVISAGYYSNVFNANDLASGIYLFHLNAESQESKKQYTKILKLMLVK